MDREKIDETVLALLYLVVHDRGWGGCARTWKSFDWEVMNRLHEWGLIFDPVGKVRSAAFTEEGLRLFGAGVPEQG